MKILIIEAGIIGTIDGWALPEVGHDVTYRRCRFSFTIC